MQERTQWTRGLGAPLRAFLRTESGSAGVLVAAIAAALVWANVDVASYEAFWRTDLAVRIGGTGVSEDLRTWVNSGLMTIFFLVVGLEARREFDLGDLRERRRFVLPFVAGLAGMLIPVLIYLALNAGGTGAHGWGVAMSTDTALALGLLALLGKGVPDAARVFLLTVFVVDDLVALLVIAVVYSEDIEVMPLLVAFAAFGVWLLLRYLDVRRAVLYALVAIVLWAAMLMSGVDPVVAGLAMGLTAVAYTPAREKLEAASGLFKLFREQPTPELARSAALGMTQTLSPNDRLQRIYHPWSSYVIVPLFGLANAGIAIDGGFLARAFTSPVTWGVILGYLLGKPIAVVGVSALLTWLTHGRIRPGVGWAAVLGSGTIAGIGFTVSLLIAALAFEGPELAEVKIGVLTAAAGASLLTWTVFRVTSLLPADRRARALLGETEDLTDLVPAVDPDRDHVRGPADASVTVVEYGDFQCPYCGRAEPAVRDLITDTDLRYVWRHLPLTDVHPQAQLAAEAAEAAAAQGKFWEMHDVLLDHQDKLRIMDLLRYAAELGLDTNRFHDDLMDHVHVTRVAEDLESADASGVSGTPTFFINGRRHYGAYDIATLKQAVKTARARVGITRVG
ncbi:sodium/proton antiporter [Actinoplanes friuliensis DSM 7358]|uniref:Na(+)/H(+) antiporter NhaA n=2 Tax=Actinoplanes friuliensis TaxID=196914 RepID=U5VYW9_9ACTN|nr:Na+/H+ antiporter NhaA [Actinoplanes friuliensis]AGZ42163.1 sodium/proton antiporter [Actinoplanes friuliensis DSM 7358]